MKSMCDFSCLIWTLPSPAWASEAAETNITTPRVVFILSFCASAMLFCKIKHKRKPGSSLPGRWDDGNEPEAKVPSQLRTGRAILDTFPGPARYHLRGSSWENAWRGFRTSRGDCHVEAFVFVPGDDVAGYRAVAGGEGPDGGGAGALGRHGHRQHQADRSARRQGKRRPADRGAHQNEDRSQRPGGHRPEAALRRLCPHGRGRDRRASPASSSFP